MFIILMHLKKIFDKNEMNFIFGGGAGKYVLCWNYLTWMGL